MSLEFQFVLASFACFRLAELIAIDDIALKFRLWVANQSQFLSRLVTCPYCLGIYFALPLALWMNGFTAQSFVTWFAIAGAQAFLQTVAGRNP